MINLIFKLYFILALLLVAMPGKLKAQNSDKDKEFNRILNLGEVQIEKDETLPIEIIDDMIVIKIKVNGVEESFLWDNGFSTSALDLSIQDKVKLTSVPSLKDFDARDGNAVFVKMNVKLADKVELGNVTITNTPFTDVDFSKMIGKVKIKGILGSSIIRKLNWRFDFDHKKVTVSRNTFAVKGTVLPFEIDPYNNYKILFGVNFRMGVAQIDFGYNGDTIEMPMQALPIFGKTKKSVTIGSLTSSVSGISKVDTTYTIKEFDYRIGDSITKLKDPVKILLTNKGRPVIGNRFFRHYNICLNNSAGSMILTPRTTSINNYPEKTYGFSIAIQNNKFVVVAITDNPNVIRYPELRLNDEFVSINGKSVDDFIYVSDFRLLLIESLLANKSIKVVRKDGKEFLLSPEEDIYR
ncbi:Aspartyl protease [Chryseobacterium carnipullorum]|uniref:aspartyl protease family protein n=1 Tax=Chryseobacterium carnipullorum TaxID=1124835 RepID=UPI0009129A54|nr:aspartyl protease family protein [Chryseobacterium carnipullorum]SHL74767.1 Aspartyl protease [Chryseobacterium carnipullorum]